MGTYADSLLSEGETVIRRERQHWLALLLDSRAAIGIWLVAVLILIVLWILVPSLQGTGRTILNYVFTGAVIIGAIIFALPLLAVAHRGIPRHDAAAAEGVRDHQQGIGRQLAREDQRRRPVREPARTDPRLRRPGHPHRGRSRGRPLSDAPPRQGLQDRHAQREAHARARSRLRRDALAAHPDRHASRHGRALPAASAAMDTAIVASTAHPSRLLQHRLRQRSSISRRRLPWSPHRQPRLRPPQPPHEPLRDAAATAAMRRLAATAARRAAAPRPSRRSVGGRHRRDRHARRGDAGADAGSPTCATTARSRPRSTRPRSRSCSGGCEPALRLGNCHRAERATALRAHGRRDHAARRISRSTSSRTRWRPTASATRRRATRAA